MIYYGSLLHIEKEHLLMVAAAFPLYMRNMDTAYYWVSNFTNDFVYVFVGSHWPKTDVLLELLMMLFIFWLIFSFKLNIIENEKYLGEAGIEPLNSYSSKGQTAYWATMA